MTKMTRKVCVGLLLVVVLGGAGIVHAQELGFAPSYETAAAASDATPQGISPCDPANALRAVAGFLRLSPEQVGTLGQLLQAREDEAAPLLRGIAERQWRLHELLASGGHPLEIGVTVVEIHELKEGVVRIQAEFLSRFDSLLTADQTERWRAIQTSERLQPILPAFRTLRLL